MSDSSMAWVKGVVIWVSMVIFVGGETAIRIEGLSKRSESEVLGLIGERLVYVKSKPASAWRANDAAFMVEQLLRTDGYRSAVVEGLIVSEQEIVLRVNEGVRFTLGKVEISGVKNGEEIEKIFKSPFAGNMWLGDIPYREADLVKGLDYVERSFKSLGYWEVELEMKRKEVDEESGVVNLELEVREGRRYRIGEPKLVSSDGRGVKRAAETWRPFVGGWATTENIMKMKVAMVEAFTSRGYPNAVIEMRQRLANGFYYPEFVIELGTRVKLSKVRSDGLERTKPGRVAQIMAPLEGDWYDEAAMNKKVRQLLATGAFDSVWVESEAAGEKLVDVTLHFQETKAKEVTFSGGFETFTGPLFRAYYVDRNFRGKLRAFSTGLELSGRGALGEVKLVDPWWRGTDISHELRLFSLVKTYDGYTGYENGLQSSWKWNFSEKHSIELMLGGSFVGVDEDGLPSVLLGPTDYTHLRVGVTQRWDYRDSVVLPKDGWHVEVPVQAGVVMHDESEMYLKVGVDGGWYKPLGGGWHLGVGGRAEYLFSQGGVENMPVDLRVFNGGARSVRSFPERELGPTFGGDAYGGEFGWVVNAELSRNLTGVLMGVVFVDAGGLVGNYLAPREEGVEVAAGLGVRLDLPIGPVRLEYGHNMTQGRGEPSGTWHFAIGATF